MKASAAVSSDSAIAECPVWSPLLRALIWIDVVTPSRLFIFEPDSGTVKSIHLPEYATGLALADAGFVVVAARRELLRVDLRDGTVTATARLLPDEQPLRANDGRCGPDGRFWYGVMADNFADVCDGADLAARGGLWSIDADLFSRHRLQSVLGCPNALSWSPDGCRMYFADSVDGWVYAAEFDVVTGSVSEVRPFARAGGRGVPDGAAIDAAGYLWNARWDGGCVVRFAPTGDIDLVIDLPVSRPTSCAFGGDDLGTLFVTTSRYGVDLTREPHAGSVFAIRAPIAGLPSPVFSVGT